MARNNFLDASLHPPPAHGHNLPPDEAGCAVLDIRAYVADRRNATTAYGRMSNGREIQVTFCVAPPPVTSYFCVCCPDPQDLTRLSTEPRIIAAEADLILLAVGHGSGFFDQADFFVYYAGGGSKKKRPWLRRLAREDNNYSGYFNLGLLRLSKSIRNDDEHFYVVSLSSTRVPWKFDLHVFDSKTETWSCRLVSLQGRKHQHSQFNHSATKVVMLGEEDGGLMGFVDPWRGILVCDVLDCDDSMLHYMPFPRSLRDNEKLDLEPVVARDVAVVNGRIKVVDCFRDSAAVCWKASIWSRSASSWEEEEENCWHRDYKLDICSNLVGNYTLHFDELLCELQDNNDHVTPIQTTLERLCISHPRLSLNGDIVYLMAKVRPRDERAWLLAVDLKNKRLQDAGVFRADRSLCDTLLYINIGISKYFVPTQGRDADLKRPGNFLLPYPNKKLAVPTMDDVPCQQDTEWSTGSEDLDNMALD